MAPFKFPRVVTRTKLQDCVLCWLQWERNKATLSVFKDVTFELPVSLPWGSNVCNWETFFSRMKSQDSLSSSLALKLNNIVWFFFKHYKQWTSLCSFFAPSCFTRFYKATSASICASIESSSPGSLGKAVLRRNSMFDNKFNMVHLPPLLILHLSY